MNTMQMLSARSVSMHIYMEIRISPFTVPKRSQLSSWKEGRGKMRKGVVREGERGEGGQNWGTMLVVGMKNDLFVLVRGRGEERVGEAKGGVEGGNIKWRGGGGGGREGRAEGGKEGGRFSISEGAKLGGGSGLGVWGLGGQRPAGRRGGRNLGGGGEERGADGKRRY